MKREFLLLIALTMVMLCRAQQAIHLSNGATLAIHNNTELTLLGGITLEEGSSLNNNGTLRLKNNPVTNLSNWIDNSLTGAISGTGLVIFNSANPHSFAGFSSFYSLQLNAAGLLLNNHLSVSNQLHLINGKINTGTNHIFLNNSDASSFLNDVSNNGYANSWINGNFRRMITANTSTYDFPVGNDTKCNLLQFLNNNITGTTQLTASFGPKPGTDDGLNVSEGEDQYVSVNDNGVWHLNPDAAASGGNHALQLFFNGFTGLTDNQFGMLHRPDASNNAADWIVPAGSSLEAQGGAGRKASDGYARRINISEFSQWGIGQFQASLLTWYEDSDGDGYGNAEVTQQSSTQPAGYVSNATDCDDDNAAVHPGATEVCNGIDDDCDGLTDGDDPGITDQTIWHADTDGDGYGNAGATTFACNQPSGYVGNDDDCDDTNPAITVESTWYADTDGDGYGNAGATILACSQPPSYVNNDNDCNDTNAAITIETTWYADADNDSYGNAASSVLACTQPAGYVSNDDDCNDAKGQIHPGATEVCNGVDDNCDGQTDEGCAIVRINDVSVYESAGAANLTVSLSQATNLPVKISYKTMDGTAVSSGRNKDYKGVGNGSMTIPAGQTSVIIVIGIYTDNINEGDEYFDVQITKASNAALGDNTGRVTIHNGTAAFITGTEKGRMKASVAENLEILAYPNPSNKNFTLNVKSSNLDEKIKMLVVDVYGRIIEVRNVKANSTTGVGDHYSPGVYFVRIIQGRNHKEFKLIKLAD